MEYDDPSIGKEVAAETREFIDDVVLPVEEKWLGKGPVPSDVIEDLRSEAREWGIYAPQISEEFGGLGLNFREMLPVFEQAGRSLLGGPALHCEAPDEGNMHTLEMFGTEEQKNRWLPPLVQSKIRSGFSMTEPIDGAGSDPKMIQTTAQKDGNDWIINGHKWWTTNGGDADLLLVLARTDHDAHPYNGSTIFLVPADTEGVEIIRDIPYVGGDVTGISHAEIVYDNVRVPEENVLGELNEGFTVAMRRLGPARLTHCMRYAGMADRAIDVAAAYMHERDAFGSPVAEKQGLRFDLVDEYIKLHAARTMVRHAAEKIRAGEEARTEVSMSKIYTANACQDAIDTALQVCGGAGISKDLPLADFYENVRQFRIIDGADEVHKRTVARDIVDDPPTNELGALTRFGSPRRQ